MASGKFIRDPYNNVRRGCTVLCDDGAPKTGGWRRPWVIMSAFRGPEGDLRYTVRHIDTGERRMVRREQITNLW
jgi:hypothetical protein